MANREFILSEMDIIEKTESGMFKERTELGEYLYQRSGKWEQVHPDHGKCHPTIYKGYYVMFNRDGSSVDIEKRKPFLQRLFKSRREADRWGEMRFVTFMRNLALFVFGIWLPLIAMNPDSEYWYYERAQTVIDKEIHTEEGHKGKVFEEGYLKLQWDDTGGTYWKNVSMSEYLNKKIGSKRYVHTAKDGAPYYWRRIVGWFGALLMLSWIVMAGIAMGENFG